MKRTENRPREIRPARLALCDRCRARMRDTYGDRLIDLENRRVDTCSFCVNRYAVQSCELWPPVRYRRQSGGGERQRAGR